MGLAASLHRRTAIVAATEAHIVLRGLPAPAALAARLAVLAHLSIRSGGDEESSSDQEGGDFL